MPLLQLHFIVAGVTVDVINAYPSTFYSWLPDWIAQYPTATIHARIIY